MNRKPVARAINKIVPSKVLLFNLIVHGRTRSSDFNKAVVAVAVAIVAIVAIRSDLRQARLGVMPVAVS